MGNAKAKELRERDMAERRMRQENERSKWIQDEEDRRKKELETKYIQAIKNFQAASRAFLARKELHDLRSMAAKRQNIVNELLATERSYRHSLDVCIGFFYKPLSAAAILQEQKSTRDFKRRKGQTVSSKEDIEHYYHRKQNSAPENIMSAPTETKSLSRATVHNIAVPDMITDDLANVPDIPDLTRDDVRILFSIIEAISLYSKKLEEQLEQCMKMKHMTEEIGQRFLEMGDFLKGYIQYVNNYTGATQTLQRLEKNAMFVMWLEQTYRKKECNNMTLPSFLIMPIQRIPRYLMLLQDLLKNIPEGAFKEKLEKAVNKIKEVATTINEKKREAENFATIVSYYHRIEPKLETLCEPHRKFLREGSLKEEGEYFTFLLFNDILLKVRGKDQLRLLTHISLKTATVDDVQDDPENKIKNTFQIQTPLKTFYLKAKTPELKQEWLTQLTDIVSRLLRMSNSFVIKSSANMSNGNRSSVDEVKLN